MFLEKTILQKYRLKSKWGDWTYFLEWFLFNVREWIDIIIIIITDREYGIQNLHRMIKVSSNQNNG